MIDKLNAAVSLDYAVLILILYCRIFLKYKSALNRVSVFLGQEQYTWWSNRGQAWAKNVGWCIDYQVATPNLKSKITAVDIYKEKRFSDHAPLIIDYDFEL